MKNQRPKCCATLEIRPSLMTIDKFLEQSESLLYSVVET